MTRACGCALFVRHRSGSALAVAFRRILSKVRTCPTVTHPILRQQGCGARLTMDALYQLSYVGLKLASYRRRTGGGPEEQTDSARRG